MTFHSTKLAMRESKRELSNLKSLTELNLAWQSYDPTLSVDELKKLVNLRKLSINGLKFTLKAWQRLKYEMAQCDVGG